MSGTVTKEDYILNEIKLQERAAIRLIIFNSALIGLFFAFLMNGMTIEAIRTFCNSNSNFYRIGLKVLLCLPIILWFGSIIFSKRVIKLKIEDIMKLVNSYLLTKFLIETAEFKQKNLMWSLNLIVGGLLIIIFCTIIIAIPYQLAGIANTYVIQGDEHLSLSQYNESIDDYNEAIEIDPSLLSAYAGKGRACYAIGTIHMDQNDYPNAIKYYKKAIATNQEPLLISKAWNNLGHIYKEQKNPEALGCFINATKIYPNEKAWYNMGTIYLKDKQIDKSIECFDEAIEIDRAYLNAYIGKAKALKSDNRVKEANDVLAIVEDLGYDKDSI